MSSDTNEKPPQRGPSVDDSMDKDLPDNEYFLPISRKTKKLPDWLDHFNLRDMKILFKCSAAVWILTLLIVINPTLKAIGQATFFGVIVIFIAPPSGVAITGILVGAMIVIGVCLGWVWGVITMKAALATRPAADLQAQYAALKAAATSNTTNVLQASGQSNYQQVGIYEGYLLDTRVTATYFCMLGLFIYLVARLRVAAPKLALVQMFAIIITDIYLTIAPLIPTFVGTLPQTLVIPAGIAVGINLVCNLLFFPQSTSHIVMIDMMKLLSPMDEFLTACSIHYSNPDIKMDLDRLERTRGNIIQLYQGLEGNMKFLALDFSMCRWSAGDVSSLGPAFRQVMITFLAMIQIETTRLEFLLKDKKLLEMAEKTSSSEDKQTISGGHQFAQAFDLRRQFRNSDYDSRRSQVVKDYGLVSEELLKATVEALATVRESINYCNEKRWSGRPSEQDLEHRSKDHRKTLNALNSHIQSFPGKVAEQVINRHKLAKEQDGDSRRFQGTIYVLVMEERLLNFAGTVADILGRIIALDDERHKTRLWTPTSIKNIVPLALDQESADVDLEPMITRIQTNADKHEKAKNREGKTADKPSSIELASTAITSSRGQRQRSKFGKFVIGIGRWFGNTEGLYALRVLIVSLALGIIAVNRNTAGFFYREKGLWALIMAQTGLMPYTADFVYGLVVRLIGTVIGAVIGLACWYIGAGNGNGSAYGIAAIMLVPIVIAMWLRLFASPAMLQGIIICTATVYLVVAYSWVDTHIPSYGNPGVGVAVFWRRLLLVLIGFAVGTFVTMFPRPPSANRHYRRVLSHSIQTNKDQYALFQATRSSQHSSEDVRKVAEQTALKIAETLFQIQPLIKLTQFELSTSNFDSETLGLVCRLCMNINTYITQLTLYTAKLPQDSKDQFFEGTGAAAMDTIADVMSVLTIIQHALSTGEPLPAVLHTPLMERKIASMKLKFDQTDFDISTLKPEILADQYVRHYMSAVAAFVQLLGAIDELVLAVKRAVGETNHVDLEA